MKSKLLMIFPVSVLLIIMSCKCNGSNTTMDEFDTEEAKDLEVQYKDRLEQGVTFNCPVPYNSYSHVEGEFDTDYEESWIYNIHINPFLPFLYRGPSR